MINYFKYSHHKNSKRVLHCYCSCGKEFETFEYNVKNGHTKSCGCLLGAPKEYTGKSKSKIYRIYRAMRNRCSNPNNAAYKYYGGKGIKVCERWEKFSKFLEDMESTFEDGLTIERKNINQGYGPDNCVWATKKEQANNTSRNVVMECFGESKNLKQWADEYGMKWHQLNYRIKNGWDLERALTTPINTKYRRKTS